MKRVTLHAVFPGFLVILFLAFTLVSCIRNRLKNKRPNIILIRADGPDGEYLTDRLTEEAMRFIEKHAGQPFFLYLPHFAVHTPGQALDGQSIVPLFRGKKQWKNVKW